MIEYAEINIDWMTDEQRRKVGQLAGLGDNWNMPRIRVIHGSEVEGPVNAYITGQAIAKRLMND